MSLKEGIDSVQRQVALTLSRAQCALAYIAAHPEKGDVFLSAAQELRQMIEAIKKVKLKDPRINRLYSASSLLMGAKGGLVDFSKSVTEGLVEIQVGVCPSDPLSVIGFYHTQLVIPIFGTVDLALKEPLLRVAVDKVIKRLGLTDPQLEQWARSHR